MPVPNLANVDNLDAAIEASRKAQLAAVNLTSALVDVKNGVRFNTDAGHAPSDQVKADFINLKANSAASAWKDAVDNLIAVWTDPEAR